MPWFNPADSYHPGYHRMKEAFFHAKITPDLDIEPVPPPHRSIIKYFDRPERFATRAKSKSAIDKARKVFDVTEGTLVSRYAWAVHRALMIRDQYRLARHSGNEKLKMSLWPKMPMYRYPSAICWVGTRTYRRLLIGVLLHPLA